MVDVELEEGDRKSTSETMRKYVDNGGEGHKKPMKFLVQLL